MLSISLSRAKEGCVCVYLSVCVYVCVCDFDKRKNKKTKKLGWGGEEPLIAARICASSWALGAPMRPISPHQTHSLGLSVNTNTQTHRLNERGGEGGNTNKQISTGQSKITQ